jgi:hypothetical protein
MIASLTGARVPGCEEWKTTAPHVSPMVRQQPRLWKNAALSQVQAVAMPTAIEQRPGQASGLVSASCSHHDPCHFGYCQGKSHECKYSCRDGGDKSGFDKENQRSKGNPIPDTVRQNSLEAATPHSLVLLHREPRSEFVALAGCNFAATSREHASHPPVR